MEDDPDVRSIRICCRPLRCIVSHWPRTDDLRCQAAISTRCCALSTRSSLPRSSKVATPVNWQQGEDVIIAGSVTDKAAPSKVYPQGWKAPSPCIRIVPQPRG